MCKKILRAELEVYVSHEIEDAELYCKDLLSKIPHGYIVFPWDKAPKEITELCNYNGGDEDWVIITEKEETDWLPNWIEHTDSCWEPDIYYLDGFIIYVGSHA